MAGWALVAGLPTNPNTSERRYGSSCANRRTTIAQIRGLKRPSAFWAIEETPYRTQSAPRAKLSRFKQVADQSSYHRPLYLAMLHELRLTLSPSLRKAQVD